MNPVRKIKPNAFAALFLVAFLLSQSVSVFGGSYVSSITESAAYHFNDAGVVVTIFTKEVSTQAVITFIGFVTFLIQTLYSGRKISKPFVFAVADRNSFYRYTTINAP